MFFQPRRWLVCLMPFTFGMPWRKKGEYSGKKETTESSLQLPSSPASGTGVMVGCPVVSLFHCRGGSLVPLPHRGASCSSEGSPAAEPPPLSCRSVGTQPPPSNLCVMQGQDGDGQPCGQGWCLWASGLFNCCYLTSEIQCPEYHFSVLQRQWQQE